MAEAAPAPSAGEQLALFVGAPQEDKEPPGSLLMGTLAIGREGGDSNSPAPGAVPLTYLCAQPGCESAFLHRLCKPAVVKFLFTCVLTTKRMTS